MNKEELENIKMELNEISPWPWNDCDYHYGIQDKNENHLADWSVGIYQQDNKNYNLENGFLNLTLIGNDWFFVIKSPARIAALIEEIERLNKHIADLELNLDAVNTGQATEKNF